MYIIYPNKENDKFEYKSVSSQLQLFDFYKDLVQYAGF